MKIVRLSLIAGEIYNDAHLITLQTFDIFGLSF